MVTVAALLGIDACPMEGFEHCAYDDLLGLEARGLNSLAVVALGYRDPADSYAAYPKVRLPAAQIIRHV